MRLFMGTQQQQHPFASSLDLAVSPCFSIFTSILDEVELRFHSTGKSTVPFFLQAVLGEKFPHPGESVSVSVVSWKVPGRIDTLTFARPDDNESLYDYVDFAPLLVSFNPEHLLAVFAALLVERRIIFVAERLSTLSACVQAAAALLYPLSWQHVFIPVLPPALLTYCSAPMPFVVGILSESLAEVQREDTLEEVLLVELDHDRLLRSPGNDVDLLPMRHIDGLLHALQRAARAVRAATASDSIASRLLSSSVDDAARAAGGLARDEAEILTASFAEFFVELFAPIVPQLQAAPADDAVDRRHVLAAARLEERELLEAMTRTQMFERWAETRRAAPTNRGPFERRLAERLRVGVRAPSSAAAAAAAPHSPLPTPTRMASGDGWRGLLSRITDSNSAASGSSTSLNSSTSSFSAAAAAAATMPSSTSSSSTTHGISGGNSAEASYPDDIMKKGPVHVLASGRQWKRRYFVWILDICPYTPREPNARHSLDCQCRSSSLRVPTAPHWKRRSASTPSSCTSLLQHLLHHRLPLRQRRQLRPCQPQRPRRPHQRLRTPQRLPRPPRRLRRCPPPLRHSRHDGFSAETHARTQAWYQALVSLPSLLQYAQLPPGVVAAPSAAYHSPARATGASGSSARALSFPATPTSPVEASTTTINRAKSPALPATSTTATASTDSSSSGSHMAPRKPLPPVPPRPANLIAARAEGRLPTSSSSGSIASGNAGSARLPPRPLGTGIGSRSDSMPTVGTRDRSASTSDVSAFITTSTADSCIAVARFFHGRTARGSNSFERRCNSAAVFAHRHSAVSARLSAGDAKTIKHHIHRRTKHYIALFLLLLLLFFFIVETPMCKTEPSWFDLICCRIMPSFYSTDVIVIDLSYHPTQRDDATEKEEERAGWLSKPSRF